MIIGQPEGPTDKYFGHESRVQLPEKLCLIGCVFFLVEHEVGPLRISESMRQVLMKNVIKLGGQFELNYNSTVTHVLCQTQQHPLVQQALAECKRCVTIFWLNEILEDRKMRPPFRVWHLPSAFATGQNPCSGKVCIFFT